jgi:RNase H-like domain found in reverse transcriptase
MEKEKENVTGTICIDPSKKHGLEEWPRELKSVKEVRSTLGVLGYQRQFVPNFAHITQPLMALLKKGTKFQWSQACTNAVDALIECVTCDPVLQRPDTTKPFILEVDASQYASRAILHQPDEQGRLRPVAYYSQTFNGAERNYDIHDRKLLAIMRGLEQWQHLILSSPHKLTVISDHANL